MTFEEDLTKRRIDVPAFATGDPEKFAAWQLLYQQVHPNTFYTTVKMIINDVRRRFWLQEVPKPAATPVTAPAKPVARRATAVVPSMSSAIPDEPSPSVDRTPEPAPTRGRAVIRRAPVSTSAVPEEQEVTKEPTPTPASETTISETLKLGRARPVFRRSNAETIPSASTENETEKENSISVNFETAASSAEPELPKPNRPRPVFRKPTSPASNTPAPDPMKEASVDPAVTSRPEHSNPDPTDAPQPPRPRPVFKRPTPATSSETEKAVGPSAGSSAESSQLPATEEAPGNNTPESAKPPRPRPVFKRPAGENLKQEPEKRLEEPKAETNPEIILAAEAPKLPRLRPIIKRPAASTESPVPELPAVNVPVPVHSRPVGADPENKSQEQTLNPTMPEEAITPIAEIKAESLVPKTPRPRPVFKRPAKPESPTNAPEDNPAAE